MLPDLVICFRFLPSLAIVKICDLPDRVDMNARWRPFGANAGLSFVPSPKVSCRTLPLARSFTLMSLPGPVREV